MNTGNVWFIIITYQPKDNVLNTLKAVLHKNNVRIIENTPQKNPGYGGAANVGIRYALEHGAEWVVICNQDIVLQNKDLTMFLETLRLSGSAVIGTEAGSLDKNRWTTILPVKGSVDYISGSFIAIHKNVIEKIGYFYEPYFMYYEDVDFSVRAQKAGFSLKHIPLAGFHHDVRITEKKKEKYLARNHLLFVFRNAPLSIKLFELFRLPKTLWEYINL